MILLTAVTLALTGCGRKGGLDLPPTAAVQPELTGPAVAVEPARAGNVFDPNYGTDRPPAAARGQKRSFILDPLIND